MPHGNASWTLSAASPLGLNYRARQLSSIPRISVSMTQYVIDADPDDLKIVKRKNTMLIKIPEKLP